MVGREEACSDGQPTGLVVLEGPNGAGKSAVARHLVETIPGTLVRFPDSFLRFRESEMLDDFAPIPRLLYYLAGIAHLSEEIASKGALVICDRYYASPLALLLTEGVLSRGELTDLARPVLDRIAKPMITLLLTAEHGELRRRLEDRGSSRAGTSMTQTIDSLAFAQQWTDAIRALVENRGRKLEINTTDRTIEEVCGLAEAAVHAALSEG